MIPRFEAGEFSGITPQMQEAYERDGVLVLENLINHEDCDLLKKRIAEMVDTFDADSHASVFSSKNDTHAQDAYFTESGHEIRFFFEEEAFDENGKLTKPLPLALNKVGHAMHDRDETFSTFSRRKAFEQITKGLGHKNPLLLQTMYIFKQPHIGGEVVCHQDATYLRTEPETCIGLWVALEDATEENGCLWGIAGGHKTHSLKEVMKRDMAGNGTFTETLDETPFDEANKIALPAPKGTVLVFGGLFPHLSCANRSDKSRHAFTLHVIDGDANYPKDNWLRRPDHLPLKGF